MFVALMIYYNIEHNNIFKTFNTLGKVGISLILIIYFFLWYANITELYKVMKGSKTIGAFCWKFLQFRIEALNQFGFIPKYKVMDTHDIPDFKE
jgi:purine-cytosine permease-like protein